MAARKITYNDAKAKAQQYSNLTGLPLRAPFKITNVPQPYVMANSFGGGASGPSIPLGSKDVQVDVNTTWGLGK